MDETTPSLEEVRSWIGFKLDEIGGSSVGKVDGVLVDAETGEPSWLVVRAGLRRRSAIPCEFAAAGVGRVWVPYAKDAVRAAPERDPRSGLDRAAELALCEHYGIPEGVLRRRAVAERPEGTATSVAAPSS
ncbi:MAG TPA: PRC-barrel domain-containing protein [Solirubrobacterales bacterium]|nr:PRC-barrel domain-containing protein [Solirubrobacterales bacterium]